MDTGEQMMNASSTCSATSGRSSTTSEPSAPRPEEPTNEKAAEDVN
jgi:hypothetical protein